MTRRTRGLASAIRPHLPRAFAAGIRVPQPGLIAGPSNGEKGVSLMLFVVLMPVILGFAALSIEVGSMFEVRRQLQTAVDAAALAGARELPDSTYEADLAARDYLNRNLGPLASLTEDQGVSITFATTYYPDDTITVSVVRSQGLVLIPLMEHLARLAERHSQDVAATATAIKGSLAESECIVPLGLVDLTEEEVGFGYHFGEPLVTLKVFEERSGGNFHILDFGTGADTVNDLIRGKCLDEFDDPVDPVAVGDEKPTQRGAEASNFKAFQDRIGDDDHELLDLFTSEGVWRGGADHVECPRIILVPIVPHSAFEAKPGDLVEILSFAHFFVADPLPSASNKEVVGYFVREVPRSGRAGAFDPNGIDVVRLIR